MHMTVGYRSIDSYPVEHLYRNKTGTCVPATYRCCWNDGFGARGWKLDAAIGDLAIIASTRETGDQIPTSVLIHDILDHLLSGFCISGHRAAAMASYQLSLRTGGDIRPDYLQLVNEDIRYGHVNGESLVSFLPEQLLQVVTDVLTQDEQLIMAVLAERLGIQVFIEQLVRWLVELGQRGGELANASWKILGLDNSKRSRIGLTLQNILLDADLQAEAGSVEYMRADFCIANDHCSPHVLECDKDGISQQYSMPVT
jgi:hypothetical protein